MRLRRFLTGVVPVLALAAGCAEAGGPFAGAEQAVPVRARVTGETALRVTNVEQVAAYKVPKTKPENLWAKAWIGPAGGSVEYYGFRIVVPAGAVSKVTMFTITLPKEGTERALAEFGPHNVTFAQPITIELPYAGTTAEGYDARALWYDESARAWTDVGGTLSADGLRVKTTVTHFSEYGTGGPVSVYGGSTSTSGG
ncbi:MAG: hypothetical protein ICV87_04550 [Gemmatimonadetes bacterium]|nr:hypothetical protein [Gemmatimonadota bacterium]